MQSRYWLNRILGLLGALLILAAFMLPFPGGLSGAPAINSLLMGVLLIVLTVLAIMSAVRWLDWLIVALVLWLMVSPWIWDYGDAAPSAWVHALVGIIVIAMAFASLRLKSKVRDELRL